MTVNNTENKMDIKTLLQMPYLDLAETAFVVRASRQTIRKWVSINGRTQRPHNPTFPAPVQRTRLKFRTDDVLAYMEGKARTDTFPSP